MRSQNKRIWLSGGGGGVLNERGDDKAAKGLTRLGIGHGMALHTLLIGGKTLRPLRTLRCIRQNRLGLYYRRGESIQCALASRGYGTFVRMLQDIRMRATIAGAENDFLVFGEFSGKRRERKREFGACHNRGIFVFERKGTNNS